MIIVGQAILSDDIAEKEFVCNLDKCKGACCVEGDAGAPLDEDECRILEEEWEKTKPFLSAKGIAEIERQGPWILDSDGDYSTPTIEGRECAYAVYDKKGKLGCGIEQAWKAGRTSFRKPISCHLYPIRITRYGEHEALNYHRWDICNPACHLGKELGVPVYQFLKEALIRKYGAEWYAQLEEEITLRKARERARQTT